MNVYLFLAEGFEEIEALVTVDVLRRGGVEIKTVSISSGREVTGAHGIPVIADKRLEEVVAGNADYLILPGGMPGAQHLSESKPLMELLEKHYKSGRPLAAICAAPALVLSKLPLPEHTRLTCYPGYESCLQKYTVTGEGVVTDGNLITGKGPAFATAFALAILDRLTGSGQKSKEVAAGLLYTGH
ncbi:MAG: DJ-1/PfpI family protein [Culturomica sp.]|jgi:4-methyl-5(b-hydroxyethyl)-thiazole monophosphate biosynthesis|nr:DJ-1/PfpI family protein [Culturomica sp.]